MTIGDPVPTPARLFVMGTAYHGNYDGVTLGRKASPLRKKRVKRRRRRL